MDEELLAKVKAALGAGGTSVLPTRIPEKLSDRPAHGSPAFGQAGKRRPRRTTRARAQSEQTRHSTATKSHDSPSAALPRPAYSTKSRPRRSRSTRVPTGTTRELSASYDPDLRFRRAVPLQKKSQSFHAVLGTGSDKPVVSGMSEKPRVLFSRRATARGHRRSLSEPTARSIPSSSNPVASLPTVGRALSPPRNQKQASPHDVHQQTYEHYLQLYQEQYGTPSQVTPPLSGSGVAPLSHTTPDTDASALQTSKPSNTTTPHQQHQQHQHQHQHHQPPSPSSVAAPAQLPSLTSPTRLMRVAEEDLLVQATSPLRGSTPGSRSSWAPPTRGPFATSWMRDLSAMSSGNARRRRRSSGSSTSITGASPHHHHQQQHQQRNLHHLGSRPATGERALDIRGLSLNGSSVGHSGGVHGSDGHAQQYPHPHGHLAPLDRPQYTAGVGGGVASSWDGSRDSSAARRSSITENVFAKRRSSLPRVKSNKGVTATGSTHNELVIEPADFATL